MRTLQRALTLILVAAVAVPAVAQSENEKREEEQARKAAEKSLREHDEQMRRAEEQMRQAEKEFQRAAREYARQRTETYRELAREKTESARELARIERELAREQDRHRVVTFSDSARLGILIGSSEDNEAKALGVEIEGLTPGGPAEDAGLRSGDIITAINGRPLVAPGSGKDEEDSPSARLSEMVSGLEDGEKLEIDYLRRGTAGKTTVTAKRLYGPRMKVMPAPWVMPDIDIEIPEIEVAMPEVALAFAESFLDLELLTLNPELGRYFGASEGVLVVETPEGGVLDLRAGDVILKIGSREARSPTQTLRVLRSYEAGERVTLDIIRDRKNVTLSPEMPERSHRRGFFTVPAAPVAAPAVPAKPASPAPPAAGSRGRL